MQGAKYSEETFIIPFYVRKLKLRDLSNLPKVKPFMNGRDFLKNLHQSSGHLGSTSGYHRQAKVVIYYPR